MAGQFSGEGDDPAETLRPHRLPLPLPHDDTRSHGRATQLPQAAGVTSLRQQPSLETRHGNVFTMSFVQWQ